MYSWLSVPRALVPPGVSCLICVSSGAPGGRWRGRRGWDERRPMSPVSQRSLGCTGMRHLEQLGRGTGDWWDTWSPAWWDGKGVGEGYRARGGGVEYGWRGGPGGLITRRGKIEANTCTHQKESLGQWECDFYLYRVMPDLESRGTKRSSECFDLGQIETEQCKKVKNSSV